MFKKGKDGNQILAVVDGKVNTLASMKDGVFSEKMLGDGAVIEVAKDVKTMTVLAPISGTLATVFPTGHAYGIVSKSGVEVLVHIGLDTVNLDGKGFKSFVKQDGKIKAGEPMCQVDVEFVRKNAPSVNPIMVVTSGQPVKNVTKGEVKATDVVFEV